MALSLSYRHQVGWTELCLVVVPVDTVGRTHHILGGDQSASTEHLSVLVVHSSHPGVFVFLAQ